jgi:hypothetical protein
VDNAVAKTLAELESKLQELERALSMAVSGGEQPQQSQAQGYSGAAAPEHPAAPQSDPPPTASAAGARLVDERLEQPSSAPTQAGHEGHAVGAFSAVAAPGPSSSPPPRSPDDSIELAELVRFRGRLDDAMRELLSDYDQVIRLRGASAAPPPLDQS